MNEDLKNQILELRQKEDMRVRDISEKTGVPFLVVQRIVAGVPVKKKRTFAEIDTHPKYQEKNQEIRRLRAEGMTVSNIVKTLGINEHRVSHVTRDLFVPPATAWKDQARADALAGYTRNEIMAKYNRSKSVINRTLEGIARHIAPGGSTEHVTRRSKENRERVLALRLEDKSSSEIAEITGLARNTVQKIAQEIGHPFKHPPAAVKDGRQRVAAETQARNEEAVRALRLQGKSSQEIHVITGISRKTVQSIAKRIGHPFVQAPPPVRRRFESPEKKPNNPFNQKHMPISAAEAKLRMVKMRIANQMSQFNNLGKASKITLPRLSILESEDA